MTRFVSAFSTHTGRKQRIPASWLDHPVLSKPFKVAPSAREPEATEPAHVPVPEGEPATTWTIAELTQYATDHDIDVAGVTRKADIFAAVTTTNAEPGDPNTPPAGGEQEN